MSPRAAWRLEGLGFERVYDYVPGKADWFASGLPKEGRLALVPTIGDAARWEVPTCAPVEKIGVVRERVVRGLMREKELAPDAKAAPGGVRRTVPATCRPDEPVGKTAKRMQDRGARTVLVTTSDGRLVGLVYREDTEHLAGVPA